MRDLNRGIHVVGSIIGDHTTEHCHIHRMISVEDCLRLGLGWLFTVPCEQFFYCTIDLLLAEEQQVASAWVRAGLVFRIVVLLRLFYGGFDAASFEQILYALDCFVLLESRLFEAQGDLLGEALGAVANQLRIKVIFEVTTDGALPGLRRYALTWDTAEDCGLRCTGVISVDQGRRNGLQCVDINDDGHDEPFCECV